MESDLHYEPSIHGICPKYDDLRVYKDFYHPREERKVAMGTIRFSEQGEPTFELDKPWVFSLADMESITDKMADPLTSIFWDG